MENIEHQLRLGIAGTKAQDPENRNRVYMTARDIIYRFPQEKQAALIDELTEAVKKIEYEYARLELAVTAEPAINKPDQPQPHDLLLPEPAPEIHLHRETPQKANGSLTSFKLTTLAALLALAIGISGYLLLDRFGFFHQAAVLNDSDRIATSEIAQENAGSGNEGITNLLNYENRNEMALLASSPNGRKPLTPHRLDDPKQAAISIPHNARIYSREPIRLNSGQLYLMRFQLRVSPSDAKVDLKAGFIGAEKRQGSKKEFFVHNGIISPANPRADENTFLFSGVAEWSDIHNALGITDTTGLARPAIQIRAKEDVKLWLVSISVSEL